MSPHFLCHRKKKKMMGWGEGRGERESVSGSGKDRMAMVFEEGVRRSRGASGEGKEGA